MYRLCGLLALFVTSCSTLSAELPDTPPATEFAATIARIERADPRSPVILSVRLSEAEFLADTDQGPCQQRLERAQQELDRVAASTQTHVMFPEGWARTAEVEYAVHLARADCYGDAGRPDELRAAAAAARDAAQLYTNAFDYRAAVTMQYNTAVLLHQLGDAGAITALESTLDLDREYGFADDAAENYPLLLSWQGRPADAAQVAALVQNFPKRRAILKFAWHAGTAHIIVKDTRESLWDGAINRSRAAAAYERQIGVEGDGWKVSYILAPDRYVPGVWPTLEESQVAKTVFSPAHLSLLDYKVSGAGEFGGTLNADAFSARLTDQADESIRAQAPAGADADLTKQALDTTKVALSPGLLVAESAENYQLETSMWAGATLDQGVWYQLAAPLMLRGVPRVVVQQRLEFAFTRMVPCTAAAANPTCVELVVRVAPDQGAVDRLIKHYASSTATRIVVDPATLLTYSREDRLYWYASVAPGDHYTILQSEHFKSTTTYGTP